MAKRKTPEKPLPKSPAYRMRISRLTVDKLGVKLYDRVSAVIAELVANSYDADATMVTVSAPMGVLLAERHAGHLKDKGYEIEVADNGHGMTPEEVNEFYLLVGGERRNDKRRGDRSRTFKRKVMGRKGVGKLAPLGICERIEIITSGGEKRRYRGTSGYLTAHIILRRSDMMKESDKSYAPEVGTLDGTLQSKSGTTIRLSEFDHRHVPTIEEFDRQLAQRFGLRSANWKIVLKDSEKTSSAKNASCTVGELDIVLKPHTRIEFKEILDSDKRPFEPPRYAAFAEDGSIFSDVDATFEHEDSRYPVTGWMGYSNEPYRDDLMAGVRIYCRGKIAAQTNIFNMKAGFTGEYDIRSYLVGVLNADWLDEEEDLIRTDRQDILWSHPLGKAFETWGRRAVKAIGKLTREPMRQAAWDLFSEATQIEDKVTAEFPGLHQLPIRERTLQLARMIVRSARLEELQDQKQSAALVDLALLLGPHITLEDKLLEAANDADGRTLEAVTSILRIARVAELTSFGRIADDRVKVIKKVEELRNDPDTMEDAYQSLIEQTPWLINPQWSPISDNQTLTTLKTRFIAFYKKRTGEELFIFGAPSSRDDKRSTLVMTSQFVLTTQDSAIEIIEVRRPGYALANSDMDRIAVYHEAMDAFFLHHQNEEWLRGFERFHITLVCDSIALKGAQKIAFDGLKEGGGLTQVTWQSFLRRTRRMHEAFLAEAERQKKNAGKG